MQGSRPVLDALGAFLERDGSISFEALMELALHGPAGGLYRTGCPPRLAAEGGHYATCPGLDPALGEAVARWLVEAWRETLGSPPRWHVIEVGGGDGALAEVVLDSLPRRRRAGLTYLAVETGEPAGELQAARLGTRVRLETSMVEALRAAGGEALVFSNELVDAFPAVSLVRRDEGWLEVHLEPSGSGLGEVFRPPGEWAARDAPLSVLELAAPAGGRAEAHPSYHRWLRQWVPGLRRGRLLTIDYGASTEALYARGGGGTLRAYFRGQRVDGAREELVDRLGLQDLTADVSFTDLVAWGEALGLRTVGLLTQRDFLGRYGALDGDDRPSRSFVASPHGAGSHFLVLDQERA